jgi:dTDP-glucose 4,6-dehydratase
LGGGGSFGIHSALYLLDHADPELVLGIGRNLMRPEPFSLNVEKRPRYEYHAYHVTYELDLLLELLDRKKPQVIINFAAQGEGAVSWKHSWRFFETNSMALARLSEELMKRDWLERFIQIGTSEMYGSVEHATKEDEPIKPSSPYAASKVAFDMYLMSVHKFLKFPMNIVRPSNAYCPGQLLHRVIPKAVICGLKGEKLPLHGGGRAEKSYIHARDLGRAIHLVAEKAPLGTVYNAGPALPTSIREVVERTAKALGMPFDQLCEVTGDRLGQDSRYWLDSSAIKRDLGWEPQIGWDEGLAEMVAWGRKYFDELKTGRPATPCGLEDVTVEASIATLRRNSLDLAAARRRCRGYRRRILDISQQVGALHIAPAFSCTEITDVLYNSLMRREVDGEYRDVFLMSKGHGCMIQYVILEEQGVLSRADLDAYCKPNGRLGAHPDYETPGIAASTGSLGHGLGMATGQAYAEKLKNSDVLIYCVLSDGEFQEGSTWEAMMMAANLKLDNLIAFMDFNDFGGLERMSEGHPAFTRWCRRPRPSVGKQSKWTVTTRP